MNSVGLALDILGVLLIWIYELAPRKIKGVHDVETGKVVARDALRYFIDSDKKKVSRRFHNLSALGLVLIILGFLFQIYSNFLS